MIVPCVCFDCGAEIPNKLRDTSDDVVALCDAHCAEHQFEMAAAGVWLPSPVRACTWGHMRNIACVKHVVIAAKAAREAAASMGAAVGKTASQIVADPVVAFIQTRMDRAVPEVPLCKRQYYGIQCSCGGPQCSGSASGVRGGRNSFG